VIEHDLTGIEPDSYRAAVWLRPDTVPVTPTVKKSSAYNPPPPFESFGRSVTVTVVVQANGTPAACTAEHETGVVPIRN